MAKARWIVKRSEDGQMLAAAVRRKGKLFHCSPVQNLQDLEELSGDVHLCLESGKASVLVEEFPEIKDEILQLQIQNKLDQLALFNVGESIATSYAVLEKRRQKQLLSIVALPEALTLEGIQTMAAAGKVELEVCVPAVAAIASLLKQQSSDPYIVLLITRLSALLLGVRDGIPLFLQSIPLSGPAEVEAGVAAHAISFGRQTLQRDYEINTCRLVCLGEGREHFDFAALEEENWIPDWSHCLLAEGRDIALNPALFGSLFVNSDYSLLPSEYTIAGRLKKTAGTLTLIAAMGFLVLTVLAYLKMKEVEPLQLQLEKETKELSRSVGDLRRVMPQPDVVGRVNAYMNVMGKVVAEPSVTTMLQDIAAVTPDNIDFVDLRITRQAATDPAGNDPGTAIPPPGMDPAAGVPVEGVEKAPAEQLLAQQLVITLNAGSTGDYSRVKARFDETVAGLSSRFSLRSVDWSYSEENGAGSFHCELLPAGSKR